MALTREQILEMPAGKELDALIHQYVNGKVILWKHNVPFTDEVGLLGLMPVPPYSTDIAAAWLVVEKFKGPSVGDRYCRCWSVEIDWLQDNDRAEWGVILQGHEALSRSLPLAICRAALLAKLKFATEKKNDA